MNVLLRRHWEPSGEDRWEVEYWDECGDKNYSDVQTFTGPNAEYNARTMAERLQPLPPQAA